MPEEIYESCDQHQREGPPIDLELVDAIVPIVDPDINGCECHVIDDLDYSECDQPFVTLFLEVVIESVLKSSCHVC